jgi:transcriptional regulator of arginine metabolism
MQERICQTPLHIYTNCRIFMQARSSKWGRAFDLLVGGSGADFREQEPGRAMKLERHNAIRDLVSSSLVQSQDDLRRKLRRRGFAVTQATLSRDLHEMHLFKGPGGYGLPNGSENGNGNSSAIAEEDDDSPPSVVDVIETFGLRSRQAMNQVVIGTVMGGAQPVAAALDHELWPEVVGTIAGDDTVLVICPDLRRAAEVQAKLRKMLEG